MSNKRNKKEGIFAGIGWSYAERFIAQAISMIVSIILARLLLPEDYGIVAIVTVFITIGDALVNGGMGSALVHKKDPTELDFNTICWLSLGVSGIIYAILFFCAPLIANLYSTPLLVPVIRVMGIKFIFSAWSSVQNAYVQKRMIFKRFFWSSLIGVLVSAAVGITMAFLDFGVWALIAQYLTHAVVSTLVIYFTIDWRLKFQFSWASVKELWGFGSKVLGSTIVFTLRDNIRTLIVGKQFSKEALAFYNEGQKYPALLVNDVVNSIGKVIYPALVEKREDKAKLKSLLRRSVGLSAYILTPMLVGLFMVGESFVKVFLTDKWLPCVPFLQIMCIVFVTRSLSTIFQKALLSIGKSGLNLIHETTTSILTIVCLIIASFVFKDVEIIAWSAVLVMVVGVVIYAIFVKRHIGYAYREMLVDYLPTIVISLVMAGATFLVGLCPLSEIVKFILQILAGVIVYVGLSILTKNKNFHFIVSKAKSMFKKKNTDKQE